MKISVSEEALLDAQQAADWYIEQEVHRFPVSLVYRVGGDVLRVIAVAAQRSRPGRWSGRR